MMKASENSIDIMKKQIDASYRPYIQFELKRYPNGFIYLHIRNAGKINAENLLLSLDKDFRPFGNRSNKANLKESFLFQQGVTSFTPGTEITVAMLSLSDIGKQEDISPSQFNITATYSWAGRSEPIIENNLIDLNVFRGSGLVIQPDLLYEIGEIKNMLKGIEEISDIKDVLKRLEQNIESILLIYKGR